MSKRLSKERAGCKCGAELNLGFSEAFDTPENPKKEAGSLWFELADRGETSFELS